VVDGEQRARRDVAQDLRRQLHRAVAGDHRELQAAAALRTNPDLVKIAGMRRSLSLRRERLTELTADDLVQVVGGETWSCNCTNTCGICLPTAIEKITEQVITVGGI
jgi:hypothetical protein